MNDEKIKILVETAARLAREAELREASEKEQESILSGWRQAGAKGRQPRLFEGRRQSTTVPDGEDRISVFTYDAEDGTRRAEAVAVICPVQVVRLPPEYAEEVRKRVEP